jgi:hypothetical protein
MDWTPTLALREQGSDREIPFRLQRLFNGGYAGRDQAAVAKHVEELAEIGVPAPTRTPTLYALGNNLATTAGSIQVQHDQTSGEVEYVLLIGQGNEVYVTVGSDHTDRELETRSVEWSKQSYPDIFAPEVWRYEEVAGHWDRLQMRCWVTSGGERRLYQEAALSALLPPSNWFTLLEDLFGERPHNVAVMSGTVPAVGGILYGDSYEMEMHDPVLNRTIRHGYSVEILRQKIV